MASFKTESDFAESNVKEILRTAQIKGDNLKGWAGLREGTYVYPRQGRGPP